MKNDGLSGQLKSLNSQKLNILNATLSSSVAKSTLIFPYLNVIKYIEGKKLCLVWLHGCPCNSVPHLRRRHENESLHQCELLAESCTLTVHGWLVWSSLLVTPSFTGTRQGWALSFGSNEADLLAWVKSKEIFFSLLLLFFKSVRPAVCPAGRHHLHFSRTTVQTWEW